MSTIRANTITDTAGTGAPTFSNGIVSNGNVGIGTSSPLAKLQVNGSTTVSSQVNVAAKIGPAVTSDLLMGSVNGSLPFVASEGAYPLAFFTNATEQARIDASGNFKFNSGYGSAATAYGCRAWVNFNGTGTVAIRGSGNVTSITDNNTGDYTVNFTTAMPDTNYAVTCSATGVAGLSGTNLTAGPVQSTQAVGSIKVTIRNPSSVTDADIVNVAIFR